MVAVIAALQVGGCGNSVSHGDAAVDVREEGDLDLPRSSVCAQLEDGGVNVGLVIAYCRLGAAEGEDCRTLPPNAGVPGRCVGVDYASYGVFGAYERNHRVPKICNPGGYGRVACAQNGPGTPLAPENICAPATQCQCVRFYPPDSGYVFASVPYHCD